MKSVKFFEAPSAPKFSFLTFSISDIFFSESPNNDDPDAKQGINCMRPYVKVQDENGIARVPEPFTAPFSQSHAKILRYHAVKLTSFFIE